MMKEKLMIIAGPCAAESAEQVLVSAEQAQRRGVQIVRASGWKPRTAPEFDGLKERSLPLLAEISQMGLIPATEVLDLKQAELVINAIDRVPGHGQLVLWVGSRNQNHELHQGLGRLTTEVPWLIAGAKNQMWRAEKHFNGIAQHLTEPTGKGAERLFICHRGFYNEDFIKGAFRNLPDFAMAMRVKRGHGLPMLIDPSHIGGSTANAIQVIKDAMVHDFDGMMLEVHPHPEVAQTDADQQLDWDQFDEFVAPLLEEWSILRANRGELVAV